MGVGKHFLQHAFIKGSSTRIQPAPVKKLSEMDSAEDS